AGSTEAALRHGYQEHRRCDAVLRACHAGCALGAGAVAGRAGQRGRSGELRSMAANMPTPMRAGLRVAIYTVFGALWASGCLWLLLHEFFTHPGDFGPVPNPWEPAILRLHGWIAVAAVFLLGWITAGHISDRWGR